MNKSLLARLIAILAVVAVLFFGFSPAANAAVPAAGTVSAQMTAGEGVGTASTVCANSGGGAGASTTSLLPVVRWSEATANMHSRLDNTWMGDTANLVQRHQIVGNGMAAGNFMWSLGTGLSSFAINFCLLSSAGGAADEVGSTFGNIMLNSPLLAFLIIFMIGALLWQGHRRGNMPWKTIMVKAVIVGVFAAMVAGSMASTGGGKNGDTSAYKPGVMSPGWVVTSMNNLVSSLASAPAAALAANQATQLDTGDTSTGMDQSNILSCDNYVKGLRKGYQESYGTGAGALASGVPTIMSSLWEKTGLQTWRIAQFGPTGMDTNTWCRQLEWNAKSRTIGTTMDGDRLASATTVRSVMYRVMGELGLQTIYETPAYTKTDNATADKSLIAWSACRLAAGADPTKAGSWTITPAFSKSETDGDKEGKATPDSCALWYTQTDDGAGDFDWSPNPDEVNKRTANLDLRDYVQTLHGNTNAYGLTSVFAYILSAFCMLVVFGLVSLAIIVAKVAMVVMIITVFFLLIVALMPSAGLDKLSGFLKTLLGMNLFIFGIQLLFALISIITQMLQNAGNSFLGGPGSLVSIMWAGLSPVIAVALLHMMFTKIMKVPSPFKLSAGLAWGGAAAAAGGAAFAGMSNLLDRKQGNMAGTAKRVGSKGLNQALAAASGGRLGRAATSARRGAASPADLVASGKGKGKAGLAGIAGAAGVGAAAGAGAAMGGKGKATAAPAAPESGPSNTEAPGGMFDAALLKSSEANSQLAAGKMSRAERDMMKSAGAAELAQAKEYQAARKKELGLERPGTIRGRIKADVLDSLSNTKHAFKHQPIQTSKAMAKTGAKVVLGGALMAAASPAILPTAALAGVGMAVAPKVKKALQSRQRNDQMVENYRAAAREHAAAQKEAAKTAAKQAAAPDGQGAQQQSTGPAAPGAREQGRRAAPPAGSSRVGTPLTAEAPPRPARAPQGGQKHQGAAHNPGESTRTAPQAPTRPPVKQGTTRPQGNRPAAPATERIAVPVETIARGEGS